MNKLINLLTVCRKAGKLVTGFDAAKDAVLSKKASLIILACDISKKTEKETRFFAGKTETPVIITDLSMDELSLGIGKKAGVLAICDKGFADAIHNIIDKVEVF